MKKLIALLLALVLTLSMGVTAFAAEEPAFADVAKGSWYETYVNQVTDAGLMNGVGDKTFAPNGTLSRAMFVTILYRAAGQPATGSGGTFSDVAKGSWYEAPVVWAASNGIVTGYADGRFGVNDPVTREQMMTILFRYAKAQPAQADLAAFSDTAEISAYAKDAVAWAVSTKLLTGADGKLMPKGTTSRAQAAAVLIRFLEQSCPVLTRADLEKAVVAMGWSYFAKGNKMQYCSAELTDGLSKYYGGVYRLTEQAAPEYGTTDTTIYSVCSDYVYKTYFNALNYKMFDSEDYLDSTTSAFWAFCEKYGTMLVRCANKEYAPSKVDKEWGVDPATFNSQEEVRAFLADWKTNLRPGDVMLPYGHAMLYIGDGYILDCGGKKYDVSTGQEAFENNGAVRKIYKVEDVFIDGVDPNINDTYKITDKLTYFAAIRPLNILVQDDGDKDPGNDKTRTVPYILPASIATRQQYPMLEIDRTVSCSSFGTAYTGEKLTYKVALSNKTTMPNHLTVQKVARPDYAGEDYKGITVTERIPDGVQLVDGSISAGGICKDGIITWTVDVSAGQTVDLTYDVTVTAKQGETIVSGGGFVGDIPSNIIKTAVGGKKLSDAAVDGLKKLGGVQPENWRAEYNISALTTGLDFAQRVYAKAAGVQLELPTVNDLIQGMYLFKNVTVKAGSRRYSGSNSAMLFVPRNTISDPKIAEAAKMIVPGYHGGKLVQGFKDDDRINEFHMNYLEPGDILVLANVNEAGKYKSGRIAVYLGDGKTATVTNEQKTDLLGQATEQMIWKAFAYDVFFLLRPSLALTDVNVPYDAAQEPTYGEEPARLKLDYAPLTAENQAKLQALATATDWTTKNTSFAEDVYARAGMDLTPLTQSLTVVNLLKKPFINLGGSGVNYQYILNYEPKPEDVPFVNMMVPGYRGGPDMVDDGSLLAAPTVEQLEIGDVLFLTRRDGSHYWTGVYMGDGKLLLSEYAKDKYQTYKLYDFKNNPAGYAELLKKSPTTGLDWEFFMVLRPCRGFKDINTGKL